MSWDETSRLSWIPTVFRVAPDGAGVEIQSYINGLGPRESYPELYRLVEQVFILAMPLLEKTTTAKYEIQKSSSGK